MGRTCLAGQATRYLTSRSTFSMMKRSFFRMTPTPRWNSRQLSLCLQHGYGGARRWRPRMKMPAHSLNVEGEAETCYDVYVTLQSAA